MVSPVQQARTGWRVMKLETVQSVEKFMSLRDEWNELVGRSATGFITQTWEWLFTWWEVFGEGRALHIVLARDGERLVGIPPVRSRTVAELWRPGRRRACVA